MNFDVTVKEVLGAKKLKARARVHFYDEVTGLSLDIEGLRIIDDEVKAPWVALPQESYWKNEKMFYKDLLGLNDIARAKIYGAILTEYKKLKS